MDEDVLSPIDLRDPVTAREWADKADRTRPWRQQLRSTIAAEVQSATRILELGSGPGQLAECILEIANAGEPVPVRYTCLDFSPPMHALARERCGDRATYVVADFKQPGWSHGLGTFDAIVTMQAVHELRHKRHAALLYREARAIAPLLVVCDHEPMLTAKTRFTEDQIRALSATAAEHHAAMREAGYEPRTVLELEGMYVITGRARD